MQYQIIELRRDGVRLTRDAIAVAAPVVGDLQISDWQQGNAEKRVLRRAQLLERSYSVARPVIVLFEPVLIRMTEGWFVLRGWQIKAESAAVCHYGQEWLVRSVEQGAMRPARVEREAMPPPSVYN